MKFSREDAFVLIAGEQTHSALLNDCFLYFLALTESWNRGYQSDLFEVFPESMDKSCDAATIQRIKECSVAFVDACPSHPNVVAAFMVLSNIAGAELEEYFLQKLRLYHSQGNAGTSYQLCLILELLGEKIYLNEDGSFIQSRSAFEGEFNLGVARRYLARKYGPIEDSKPPVV